MTDQDRGLYKLGGIGLVAFGLLSLLHGVIDLAAGAPTSSGTDLLAWIGAHERLLAFPSELLFFEAAFLVPGAIALYHSLAGTDKAKAATGCGILAIAIAVMAFVAIVHGRLVYPIYGIRVDAPDIAAFAIALYYGGLHAISLLLGLAIVLLALAMKRGVYGKRIAHLGFATGAFAVVGGYPYAIGPIMTLVCAAVVAIWFVVAGGTLYRLGQSGPAGMVHAAT
ncbi:MAG TPA: hypothetical protein VIG08_13930 [Gemmatimonadales bacterium]|jgi:hypothetical protein